jgi:hypothetical protein
MPGHKYFYFPRAANVVVGLALLGPFKNNFEQDLLRSETSRPQSQKMRA